MTELHRQGEMFTELVLEVFRINGALMAAGDQLARPVGLTSARWQVLGVAEHAPISVAHVARVMGLTRQSVQQTAHGLLKEGFIEYVENPHHRRSRLMQLTPKGRSALEYVEQRQAVWANTIGSDHSAAELQALVEALRQMRATLARHPVPATATNA